MKTWQQVVCSVGGSIALLVGALVVALAEMYQIRLLFGWTSVVAGGLLLGIEMGYVYGVARGHRDFYAFSREARRLLDRGESDDR